MWVVEMQECVPETSRDLAWKQQRLLDNGPLRGWDLAPDGRFLMAQLAEVGANRVTKLICVQNWFEETESKFRAGRK